MAKLGTNSKPVRFQVQTEERAGELASLCDERGWIFIAGIVPDEPEDIREIEYLLNPKSFTSQPRTSNSYNTTIVHENPKVGRNDPCPCGSGKKHKKCCMK
ncbi:MAG: SEC-C metal-binding domain-containing protein [Kiritimatiellae bacterium]|jgi:SWIM/SEC-C metal-binding protein|nr:SEC-C metal-binding domain-containing protein [Kiritimatiellia bacterium]